MTQVKVRQFGKKYAIGETAATLIKLILLFSLNPSFFSEISQKTGGILHLRENLVPKGGKDTRK